MAVEVSQAWLGTPVPVLSVQVSQAYLSSPGAAIRDASAAQTVGAFTQTATLQVVGATQVDVSWVSLYAPEGANGTRNAEAAQTVGNFTTAASLTEIIGQINGGGTITEGYPHRSAAATQTVGVFQTAAAGGGEGVLAPNLVQANQTVGTFSTVADADVFVNASAAQTVGSFTQDFRNYDLTRPSRTGGGGRRYSGTPTIRKSGKRFIAEVEGVTVVADTLAELQRKVQQLIANLPEKAPEPPPAAPRKSVVVEVQAPEPAPPEPIPAAEVERMVAEFVAQQQALVDQYQREVEQLKLASLANTAALRSAMQAEVEQRVAQAASDLDAVVALLMDESVPGPVQVPVPVITPAQLPPPPPRPEPKPEPVEVMAGEMGKLTDTIAQLQAQLSAPREVVRDKAGRVVAVKINGEERPVKRDAANRIVGV